jgi:hypothetical protein
MAYGESVHEIVGSICYEYNKTLCIYNMDVISKTLYDVLYTPTRPTSTYEDFIGKRTDLIAFIQKRYQYKSYLEIGCNDDTNFDKVKQLFSRVVCVDPEKGGTMRMTSDEYFINNQDTYDLIFIDGLHEAHQVYSLF